MKKRNHNEWGEQGTALEELVPDLLRLEELLTRQEVQEPKFNLFRVLDLWRLEDNHSRILSWLLASQESHGLGDSFLRNFLNKARVCIDDSSDWSNTTIHREWQAVVDDSPGRLDILALNRDRKYLCAIENKIFAAEAPDQLSRYRKALENEYADYDKSYVFLSPTGRVSQQQEEQDVWQPMSYSRILQLLEETVHDRGAEMGEDVASFLQQYAVTLRRYIVPAPDEIAELSREIYEKHREAIELIYQHKPHYGVEISQFLQETINEQQDWSLDDTNARYVRFYPTKWQKFKCFRSGTGWPSRAAILFEFLCKADNANFSLVVAPGPDYLRNALFEAVREHPEVFNRARSALKGKYHHVHRIKDVVDGSDLNDWSDMGGSGPANLRQYVVNFAENELPAMNEVVVSCLSQFEGG